MPPSLTSGSCLLAIQLLMVCIGVTAMIAWPPATGRILIIPLSGKAASTMIARSVATGARLLGPGPFAGSEIVDGSRVALARALNEPQVLLLAGPPAGCRA